MTTVWKEKTIADSIHALVGGEGVPEVLLPGWPETAEAYSELLPLLAPHGLELFALDLPGLGESLPSANGYDVFTISTILHGLFEGTVGEPYHLVGHDVGAWIAFAWAAQFPEEVKSLTLLDARLPGLVPPLFFPLPNELNKKVWRFSFNALPDLPEVLTKGRERELFDWLFDHQAEHPERITRARRDHYVESYSRPGKMSNGFGYHRSAALSAKQNKYDFSKEKLKMPLLALGGKCGANTHMLQNMRFLGVDVQGGDIDDCGHFVMEEQPEEVARRLLDFFEHVKKKKP